MAPRKPTRRQVEVLRLIAQGRRPCEIAPLLGVSQTTIRTHLQDAKERTGTRSYVQAVLECARRGWLKQQPNPVPAPPPSALTCAQWQQVDEFEAFLRTDDGIPWCMEFLGRIGVKLVKREACRERAAARLS